MKKILAVALAFILAFSSLSVVAFAASTAEPKIYTCPYSRNEFVKDESGNWVYKEVPCGETFSTEKEYNAHVASCRYYAPNTVSSSLSDVLNASVKLMGAGNSILKALAPTINKLISAIFDALKKAVSADGVAGAVEDLENELTIAGIDTKTGTIKDLLDTLKAKIKALYCGEPATTATEVSPESGSSATAGIAAFAAVSVAAAAAYVCTKKKDEE